MKRVLFVFLIFPSLIFSQSTDLRVSKSGQDVLLSWTGGTATYTVTYSTTPTFIYGNITITDSCSGPSEPHVSALLDNTNYFYDVAGADEMSKAVQGGGYAPPPAPQLVEIYQFNAGACTANVINSGKIGQTLCLKMRNPDTRDPSYNVIDFAGFLVPANALSDNGDGTYTLQVVIPPEAKSGYISLLVNAIKSIEEKYFYIIAYDSYGDATAFRDLSSLAFEDSTTNLWAVDRGNKDQLLEIEVNGNVIQRASRAEVVIGDFTGDYTWYTSSLDSTSNQGTFTRWDSTNNTFYNWSKSGDTSTGNPSRPLAIAKDIATEYAFVADWKTGNIKKLRESVIWPTCIADFDYGGFGGTLIFNDPGGMRVDATGNLYFTTTTSLYKVLPSESSDTMATGFSAAAGLDITAESQLLLADEGSGKIWAVQTSSPYAKSNIISNLNQPVSVMQGTRDGTNHLYVAEHQRILDFMDQSVEMQPKRNIKVLISAKHGLPYPEPAFQTEDKKIIIKIQVNPPRAATIYFKVHDPPDQSPYVAGADDDNQCYIAADNMISPQPLVTDSSGYGQVTMTLNSNDINRACAGDNFYVTAHFDSFAQPEVARTGIITAWKRVYVEMDKMFVKGSFLSADALSGASSLDLEDASSFAAGDTIQVLDADNQDDPFGQILTVDSVLDNTLLLGTQTTNQEFSAGHDDPADPDKKFGYVGILEDASDPGYWPCWEAGLSYTRQLFDQAFIEFVFPNKGAGPIPNPGWTVEQGSATLDAYSVKWWHPDIANGQNYLHLIGAQSNPRLLEPQHYGQTGFRLGFSYIYVETIINSADGNVNDTTMHELTHNFLRALVNDCELNGTCGHCENLAYTPPNDAESCEMNLARDRTNGVVRYCIGDILTLLNTPNTDESVRRQYDIIGRN